MIKKNKLFFMVNIILLLAICYFFPYTGDDWAWGTSIGLERLNNLFSDYNGRYAGNLLVLLLTRSRLVRAIVICISLISYIFFIRKFLKYDKSQKNLSYIITILLLSLPFGIITQSIAWTSGFANYVIPLLFILIYLGFNLEYFNLKVPKNIKYLQYLFLFLGLLSSLFIEHVTIYNFILSTFVLFLGYFLKKKIVKQNLYYFFGALIGSIIMFSNGAYLNVLNSTDSYRTVKTSNFIMNIFSTYFKSISDNLVNKNFIVNLIISFCIIFIFVTTKNKFNDKKAKKIYSYLSIIFLVIYNVYFGVNFIYDNLFTLLLGKFALYVEGMMAGIFIINIILFILFVVDKRLIKRRMLFEIFSICLIVMPLFIVTPIGPRCFFPIYIFWIILVCEFINLLPFEFSNLFVLKLIVLCMLFFYFLFYFRVFYVDLVRKNYIEKESNISEAMYLPKLPFEDYIWYANPKDETFKYRFKLYYDIPDSVDIKFIDYYLWKDKYK